MRHGWLSFVIILSLLGGALAALPSAGAQIPTAPQGCGPLEMTLTGPPGPVPPGTPVDVSVNVRNGGNLSASVVVAASLGGASGWRLTSPESQDKAIAADQSAPYTFTVRAADQDAASEVSLNFVADAACQAGALGCPQGQQFCRASTQQTLVLRLAPPEGFAIPGLGDLDFPPELLLAGLLLAAVAIVVPLAAKRKRVGFTATCPEPLKLVRPGLGANFPLDVRNRGKESLTATFEVGTVADGWSAFMAMPDVQLGPEEKRTVFLMVRSPADANAGDGVDIPVRVVTKEGGRIVLRVRAEVDPNAGHSKTPAN